MYSLSSVAIIQPQDGSKPYSNSEKNQLVQQVRNLSLIASLSATC